MQSPSIHTYVGMIPRQCQAPVSEPHDDMYNLPIMSPALPNKCLCSTVMYSVMAACAACQGNTFLPSVISSSCLLINLIVDIRWSTWMANCSETDITISGCVIPLSHT
jgi:hypothetical protein